MLDNLRPPRRAELMDAWRKLMSSKLKNGVPLNSTQALQCRRLLDYLVYTAESDPDVKPISTADLARAREALLDAKPCERTQNHIDLAEAIYNVYLNGRFEGKARDIETQWSFLLQAMARYGASRQALVMLYSKWSEASYATVITETKLVEEVARGLAREGHESELVELITWTQRHNVPYNVALHETATIFFAERDRIPELKQWFTKDIVQQYRRARTYQVVASCARRNDEKEWAMSIFQQLRQSRPPKRLWDVSLQAMLLMGQSMDEVKAVLPNMTSPDGKVSPDANTINRLLRAAVELKDVALAEEVSALSSVLGIEPDGETFLVLWQFHLDTGNLAAAEKPYHQVQYLEPWGSSSKTYLAREYEQLLNRYLISLCQQAPPNFPYILTLLESAEEQQIRLQPSTVAALCLRFLENDQHFEVMDILSVHSFKYSAEEREVVQTAFIEFCLSTSTSTSRAWGGYQLLHQFFQDLSYERRVGLLEEFMRRKRSDMASHVFGHMRAHRNKSYHPKTEIYIRCLEGLARYPHTQSLSMIHNMLKMDMAAQPTTKLFTALMLAYAGCYKPVTAMEFWSEIINSSEGPSYSSLEAVFWTLERKSGGHEQAQQIWEKMEKMDVEVNSEVYNAYVGAMAASGQVELVQKLVNEMACTVGSPPNFMT